MRYDSEPQVIKRILAESEILKDSLNHFKLLERISQGFFDKLVPFAHPLFNTLDHFFQLHLLNPQFCVSRYSASHIEHELLQLRTVIGDVFAHKEFPDVYEQVKWIRDRFLAPRPSNDSEQILVKLSLKITQFLDTYCADRVRQNHFAAILNEVVGWSEHIEIHGHHDIHAVILFAEKVAQDNTVLAHRLEVAREIGLLLQERLPLPEHGAVSSQTINAAALEISRMYSPYVLEFYEALLDDLEILSVAQQDFSAFEAYCHENHIDVYEEYREVIKEQLRDYVEVLATDVPMILPAVRGANVVLKAEDMHTRYLDIDEATEILGEKLAEHLRVLERAVHQFRQTNPELVQRYTATLRKVKKFRGEIMKPAIEVYGEYLKDPEEFFQHLPQHQTRWIPILDSALACLEPHDDLYRKCHQLKQQIERVTTKAFE